MADHVQDIRPDFNRRRLRELEAARAVRAGMRKYVEAAARDPNGWVAVMVQGWCTAMHVTLDQLITFVSTPDESAGTPPSQVEETSS